MPRIGRYELLREIATGGMATVHLGRVLGEGGFERLVALKVMHPHLAQDPEFVKMFLDEARLAARIRHPNVVPTLDVQKGEEGMFLVMEYVEGMSLQGILRKMKKRGQPLPTAVTLRIFADALSGLHAAHELTGHEGEPLNLVHRDVSPHNILVGRDGVTRLTDFGIAHAESRLFSTDGGQLKGKVPYMAPEQVLAEAIDRRTDVYAAGVVLWEALVGTRRLFDAQNQGALLHQVLDGAKESPRQHVRAIPEVIAEVCMGALQRAPNARYQTAAAFADALEDAGREALVPTASSRAVAEFMTALMPSSLAHNLPRPSPDDSAAIAALTPSASAPDPAAATPAPSIPSVAGTRTEAVVSMMPPRRARTGLLIAALLAGGLGGAVFIGMRSGADVPGSATNVAAVAAAPSAARVAAPTPVASTAPSAAPSAASSARRGAHDRPRPQLAASAKNKPLASPTSYVPGEL